MSQILWLEPQAIRQFIALRGHGKTPLLFIHGGPGASLLPFARSIAKSTMLEKSFSLAYWEQRGTGRSRGALTASDLTLESILTDAVAVAEALRERFGQKPIVVGHSWGSVIGVLLAAARPDLVAAYVGMGQVINVLEQERHSTAWALTQAERAGHGRAVRTLRRLESLSSANSMLRQRALLARYGGVWYGHGQRELILSGLRDYLTTPEYRPRDLVQQARDPAFSLRALLPDKRKVNLLVQAPRLEVPAFFIAGVHDRITPLELVAQYVECLEAPAGKTLVTFESSAHLPFLEEPQRFEEVVRRYTDKT